MGMKLLPKSQVEVAKSREQRQKIDEGVVLAKKIDNLREVALIEEKKLEEFRRKTVKKIHDEITTKSTERDQLEEGNKKLREERKELKKPLDEEWLKLSEAQKALAIREEGITQDERTARECLREAESTSKRSVIALTKAESRERLASETFREAGNANTEAQSILKRARRTEESVDKRKEEVERSLARRDIAASARERDIDIKETRLAREREKLKKEWALLEDRKAMLERTIKRKK